MAKAKKVDTPSTAIENNIATYENYAKLAPNLEVETYYRTDDGKRYQILAKGELKKASRVVTGHYRTISWTNGKGELSTRYFMDDTETVDPRILQVEKQLDANLQKLLKIGLKPTAKQIEDMRKDLLAGLQAS